MTKDKRTVLITGCSDGGMGAELATAFHEAGLTVYATARNLSKMTHLVSLGIKTLQLDVLSEDSIASCVKQIDHLDILVNNAGSGFSMPFSDLSIAEGKRIFDINFWAHIAVTQAFLPLLLASRGTIVNQTSILSAVALPWKSAYTASKAALAMVSTSQRMELAPFGVKVVEMKTGIVQTNSLANQASGTTTTLPEDSIYLPAKEAIERRLRGEGVEAEAMSAGKWARQVVPDLLKASPPPIVWRGGQAGFLRMATFLPAGWLDGPLKKREGLDVLEAKLREGSKGSA